MASEKRPSFISAMPRACQPSKKSGASCVQRRYFSTAVSRSPRARSPLASSNNSSTSGVVLIFGAARKKKAGQPAPDENWPNQKAIKIRLICPETEHTQGGSDQADQTCSQTQPKVKFRCQLCHRNAAAPHFVDQSHLGLASVAARHASTDLGAATV